MLGAMIGDYVGSVYEFNNCRSEEFELFSPRCFFTDDSVMSIAVAQALMDWLDDGRELASACVSRMQEWGRRYPSAGYGGRFSRWLRAKDPKPYNSWGNGSGMRVSPVGWLFDSIEATEWAAEQTAAVTHNHPEGIKGAQAIAVCVFLARSGASKERIREVVEERYGYDLGFTLDEIRPTYRFVESCQGSVPQAIVAFLESRGYEDAIRKAVSIGGDSDTIACMAGAIAEAFYGVPEDMRDHALREMPEDMASVYDAWQERLDDLRQKACALWEDKR